MRQTTSQVKWGPEFTPPIIKNLILLTCSTTLLAALLNPVFTQIFGVLGIEVVFSLSRWAISRYFIWQPLTYLFVQYSSPFEITLYFFLQLFFNMYILWIAGTDILERVGKTPFLRLYFISGIGAGLTALSMMYLTGTFLVLSGATTAAFALLTVWVLLYPEAELLLFFTFPVKAKWLVTAIFGIVFLTQASQGNLVFLSFYLSPVLIAYLYAVIGWDLHSPFAFTRPVEKFLSKYSEKIRSRFFKIKSSKIISFKSIQEKSKLSDDEFIDSMLEKISKHGQDSLTWRERHRMQKISEKKQKDK